MRDSATFWVAVAAVFGATGVALLQVRLPATVTFLSDEWLFILGCVLLVIAAAAMLWALALNLSSGHAASDSTRGALPALGGAGADHMTVGPSATTEMPRPPAEPEPIIDDSMVRLQTTATSRSAHLTVRNLGVTGTFYARIVGVRGDSAPGLPWDIEWSDTSEPRRQILQGGDASLVVATFNQDAARRPSPAPVFDFRAPSGTHHGLSIPHFADDLDLVGYHLTVNVQISRVAPPAMTERRITLGLGQAEIVGDRPALRGGRGRIEGLLNEAVGLVFTISLPFPSIEAANHADEQYIDWLSRCKDVVRSDSISRAAFAAAGGSEPSPPIEIALPLPGPMVHPASMKALDVYGRDPEKDPRLAVIKRVEGVLWEVLAAETGVDAGSR